MALADSLPSWVTFLILFIPFSIFVFIYAPSLKWKFGFMISGAIGIVLALAGRTMKGFSPVSRRGY